MDVIEDKCVHKVGIFSDGERNEPRLVKKSEQQNLTHFMEKKTITNTVIPLILDDTIKKQDAYDARSQLVNVVQTKLRAVGTEKLLRRAEEQPTEPNIKIVEYELLLQMEEDQNFSNQLEKLVKMLDSAEMARNNQHISGKHEQNVTISGNNSSDIFSQFGNITINK